MRRQPLALVVVISLVGFLLVVTGTATSVASESQAPRKKALIDQIVSQQQDVDDLDEAVTELRDQVEDAENRSARASAAADQRLQNQKRLELAAGTTAVEGKGIVIELADAQREEELTPEESSAFDSGRIQDTDIQLVVNALFAVGAEAVSINDNRVVAVTPIRAAGGTIVVNYRPVNSPYRITATGVDKDTFSDTDIAGHFEQWEERFGLGFEIDGKRKVTVPAYSGRVGIDLARSVPAPVPVPAPAPAVR